MKKWLAALLAAAAVASGAEFEQTGDDRKIAVVGTLDETVSANSAVEFEWQAEFSRPPRYAAFGFTRKKSTEVFVFYGSDNALSVFESNKWYTTRLPLTALKPLSGAEVKPGDTLSGFNFWIENSPGSRVTLRVKNLRFFEQTGLEPRIDAEPDPIQVWPRMNPIYLTDGEQLLFVELPRLNLDGVLQLRLSGVEVTGCPDGTAPALPPDNLTAYPDKIESADGTSLLTFPARDYSAMASIWIPLAVRPGANHRELKIEAVENGSPLRTRTLAVEYVEPKGATAEVPVAVWYFTGLEPKYVPLFVDALARAGVNSFYAMEGELADGSIRQNTVHDYARSRGFTVGVAFFTSKMMDYYNNHPVTPECAKLPKSLRCWADHPAAYKAALRQYLLHLSGGKPEDVVVYDAETGAFKPDRIAGDLSDYALAEFGRQYCGGKTPTPADLPKMRKEWIEFNCRLSSDVARLSAEAVRELWPEAKFKVYSGYQYDSGPRKGLTRERYAVDWPDMARQGIDWAGAGYQGSMEELAHMASIMGGEAKFIPAEAYLWGFDVRQSGGFAPHRFKVRLARAFLNSGLHGISIWQAHALDASALEAIAGFTRFAAKAERFEGGTVEHPEGLPDVYILRKGDETALAAINPTGRPVEYRFRLSGEQVLRLEPYELYCEQR
ncbi:MAG: hypothetical protein AB7F40_11675 [Victivallaceae bacterium]|nr:hypothetical protein [Victivallaceae bacterium]